MFYTASKAAEYLGISRQRFYVVKDKYRIKERKQGYAALDLMKVRILMDKWKKAHAPKA